MKICNDMINEYTQEKTCTYKDESYLVRDNGSICRLPKDDKKIRPSDKKWTFGTKDKSNGYMIFCGERVHRIVATAFYGEHSQEYVVDHIDTNRCNNRVENLRWLTKLENILRNPITVKKITAICGSVDAFLEDPSSIGNAFSSQQNLAWMRTVSAEEGRATLERLTAWANKDTTFSPGKSAGIGEWIFKRFVRSEEDEYEFDNEEISQEFSIKNNNHGTQNILDRALFGSDYNIEKKDEDKELTEFERRIIFAQEKNESLTKGALQKGFVDKMSFPLCPELEWFVGLYEYAVNLEDEKVFAISENGTEYVVDSVGWTWEWDAIQVEVKSVVGNERFCVHIIYEDGVFVHYKGNFKSIFRFCDSPNVLQCGAITKNSFPSCSKDGNISLEEYADILQKGVLVQKNQYTEGYVIDREITKSKDGFPILYVGVKMSDPIKPFGEMTVFIENRKIIHQLGHRYFDPRYLEREFCKMRGQEWIEDPNDPIMDDYC